MKINASYVAQLLTAFQDSQKPYVSPSDFANFNIELDDILAFHLEILADKNFIDSNDPQTYVADETVLLVPGKFSLGFRRAISGKAHWDKTSNKAQLRLTASGHDFAEYLSNQDVLRKVTRDLKNASISTLWSVTKKMGKAVVEKKAKEYLEDVDLIE